MNKHDAILELYKNVTNIYGDDAFDVNGNDVIYDETAVQSYIASHSYIAQRQKAYPIIDDQLDLIYHQGLDAWKSAIQAVKEEFPK
jgi:hypothetical protein